MRTHYGPWSTVFAAALFFCLLSVERVKAYHRSVFVVAIGYIVNHWIYSSKYSRTCACGHLY
jgi:uncharacterized membrane protein YjjB (DUF3815 family)